MCIRDRICSDSVVCNGNLGAIRLPVNLNPDGEMVEIRIMQNRIFHERLQGKLGDRDLIRLFGREIRDQLDVAGAFHLIDSDKFPDIFDFPGKGGS